MTGQRFVGLMSGTSVDAIDAALVEFSTDIQLIATHQHPISPALQEEIRSLSHSGADEIERLGRLDRRLGILFGEATIALLKGAGQNRSDVRAIGSHGQTIRHRPPSAGHGKHSFTLQIGDPNTIAEITGITTVADFRRRDMAAGGEGAPLAPAFHAGVFATEGRNRAVVNIGGIANVSLLLGTSLAAGFDSGPGNTLLDGWIQRHRQERYDRDGAWAAGGQVQPALLETLLRHPYLNLTGPRSTGKEDFNLDWLDQQLSRQPETAAADVQATLAQFTAQTIASALKGGTLAIDQVFLCGGGAHNHDLVARLQGLLPGIQVASTAALGIPPDWVEATLFAWLAQRTVEHLAGNAPQVTGAVGPRILGSIYPGAGVKS